MVKANFKEALRAELAKRVKVNPQYSSRAFAKFLKVDDSFLSKVLNGKRKITKSFLTTSAHLLHLDPQDFEEFRQLRARKANPLNKLKRLAPLKLSELNQEQFKIIADWYHFAILELTSTVGFKSSIPWISKALNISHRETEAAVGRLLKLNLLKEVNGTLITTSQITTMNHSLTSAALKFVQKQVLEKAQEALDNVSLDSRSQTNMTLAFNSTKVNEAKDLINEFRRRFTALMQSQSPLDSVYHLAVSFYPVSTIQNDGEVVSTPTEGHL